MTPQSFREEFKEGLVREHKLTFDGRNGLSARETKIALWSARWMAERIQIHTHSACSQDCCSDHTDKFIDKVLKELQ